MSNNVKLLLINLGILVVLVGEIAITIISGTPFIAMIVAIAVTIVAMMVFAVRPYGETAVLNISAICYAMAFIGLCVADAMDPGLSPIVGIGLGIFALVIQIWTTVSCLQGRI